MYLINTHAFHNAHLIRAILPRDLTAPIPYIVDQQSHYDQIARKLHVTQDSKPAATTLKAAEKRKAAAATAATSAGSMVTVVPTCQKWRRIPDDKTQTIDEVNAMDVAWGYQVSMTCHIGLSMGREKCCRYMLRKLQLSWSAGLQQLFRRGVNSPMCAQLFDNIFSHPVTHLIVVCVRSHHQKDPT